MASVSLQAKKKKEKKLERAQHHQTKKIREVMLDPRRKVTTSDQMYQMMKITFFSLPLTKMTLPDFSHLEELKKGDFKKKTHPR